MFTTTGNEIFLSTLVLQLLGLASVCFAHLAEESAMQKCWQFVFFVCLGCVGFATVWAFQNNSGCWISCSATLALMTVGACFDRRSHQHATSF